MGMYEELQKSSKKAEQNGNHITTGTVVQNWDKDHPGMVKVKIHLEESNENITDWIPVATPYGGPKYGIYFHPEVNDEVLVAYDNGVAEFPFVIGSVWNKENPLPENTAQETNALKKIRTKGGHEIIFEETKDAENICVQTATGLKMKLEDKPQVITIADKDGKNLLKLDCQNGAITVQAEKKISFQAAGNELLLLDGENKTIKANTTNIQIEAASSLQMKGKSSELKGDSIKVNASGTLEASGSATTIKGTSKTGVESSGMLEVKGSMVKIN